jgi:hypothetical protein
LGAIQAQAGLFKDIRYAVGYAGFSQQLQRNIIGDGWTYNYGQTFNDKEYDFGNSELILNGTMNGSFNFTRRGIPEAELNLSTPNGLAYTYESTDGPNKFSIDDGFFNIDQKISINEFGGYDIQLTVTNRGTLVYDGATQTSTPINYDIGPINVHGQWLVDVFNLTIGEALGFSLPGGGLDQITLGWDTLLEQQMQQIMDTAKAQDARAAAGMTITAIPEPMTLSLLVVGAGMLLRRKF